MKSRNGNAKGARFAEISQSKIIGFFAAPLRSPRTLRLTSAILKWFLPTEEAFVPTKEKFCHVSGTFI